MSHSEAESDSESPVTLLVKFVCLSIGCLFLTGYQESRVTQRHTAILTSCCSEAKKMTLGLINANPVVHAKKERVARTEDVHADVDAVDPLDIYDILSFDHFLFASISWVFFFVVGICNL